MLPAAVNAPKPEFEVTPTAKVLFGLYLDHQRATLRGNATSNRAARSFLALWPDPQAWADEPLGVRLSLPPSTMSLVMFLMTRRWLALSAEPARVPCLAGHRNHTPDEEGEHKAAQEKYPQKTKSHHHS